MANFKFFIQVSFTEIIGGRRQNYSVLDNDVSIKSSDDASIYAEMKLGVLYTPSAESSLESYLQLSRSDEDLNTFSLGMNFNVNF